MIAKGGGILISNNDGTVDIILRGVEPLYLPIILNETLGDYWLSAYMTKEAAKQGGIQ